MSGGHFIDDADDLPGAQETADAVAAYRRETADDGDTDAAVATEPESDVAPVSVVRAGYNTDTPEPDWIAEEDLLVPGAAGAVSIEPIEQPPPSVTADEGAGDEPELADEPPLRPLW